MKNLSWKLVRIFSAPRPKIFLGIYILPYFRICDPSACCWRSAICALVIFIILFLLSQINRWSLRNFLFLVDMQTGYWREEKTEFTLAIKMACGPPTKGAYWVSHRFGCHLFLIFVFCSKNRGACLTLKTRIGKEHYNKLHGVCVFLFWHTDYIDSIPPKPCLLL